MQSISGSFHLLSAHGGYIESPPRCFDCFASFQVVGNECFFLLLEKLRHFLITEAVYIVGGVLPVLMKHHHVRNGKAMSLKIFRVVDIKAGVNIFKGSPRRKLCGIDKRIVFRVYPVSCGSQTVVRFKAQVPCFVPAFYLKNGKGVFVLWGFLFQLLLCGGCLFLVLLLLDLCDMFIYTVDYLGSGASDCFKRAFQLRKFPPAAPTGDISKGIIRRIKSVMLADSIGYAFCFHLAGTAVNAGLLLVFRGV